MEDIHDLLDAIDSSSVGGVLAAVVKVTGSAYKKEGAAMLFKADGTQVGLLSAGCLEEDLSERLRESDEPYREFVYDMRDEDQLSWGEGSGCNGVIHVWTEKLSEAYVAHLLQLKKALRAGRSVLMLKKRGARSGYLFIPDEGEPFGCWEGGVPDDCRVIERGMFFSKALGSDVYVHRIRPKQRLVVFGAGPDARPLVSFAAGAGFSVTVSDWRPAFCTAAHFPAAEKHVIGFPYEVIDRMELKPNDCVVIMTHNFKRDQELIHVLKDKELRYLGVLGSKKRTARLFGLDPLPQGITSPAGLSIQAQGAEEIAISIVAQLIGVSHSVPLKEAACL
ncbi:XdhC family protein [Domibacillus sp. A3M-37]|uniref:XdhC family protein n=1 Tax=Domibacillus sp. A3M-37 TaxID=2962037 RepID=UPI0020B80585|nr:XdhC/CoxI family protein [Domibacillus sp. A3M-37]MCP3763609.1 XdhC family protein [Domibacillus sp. A3M-37]